MFFYIFDDSGEIECGAYEPTKNFRKLVSDLRPGDIVKLFGGIGEQNTFNIEKFQVVKLNDATSAIKQAVDDAASIAKKDIIEAVEPLKNKIAQKSKTKRL